MKIGGSRNIRVEEGMDEIPTLKPSRRPMTIWDQSLNKPYLQSSFATSSWRMGVTTQRGSSPDFARSSSMGRVPTEAAGMRISAGSSECAAGMGGPIEAEMLAAMSGEGVLALCIGCEGCNWLSG